MKAQSKRLFINNLPDGISQCDLEQKFATYGSVTSVEIKQRKNVREDQTVQFAYVQLGIDKNNLEECLHEFSNKKWKGHWIAVQEAKESFIERLKREREELKANGINKTGTTSVPIHPDDVNTESKRFPIVNVKKYHSSSSESTSDEEQDSGFVSGLSKQEEPMVQNGVLHVNDDEDRLVIKSNKGKKLTAELKIESTGSTQTLIIRRDNEAKNLGVKETEANKKRLQSLAQMRKGYQEQKSVIKNALLKIDLKPSNKIVFDDDDELHCRSRKSRHENKTDSKVKRKNQSAQNKLALFEEEDNEEHEQYNFEVKEHFEGKKGQKLMKLQSKFKNDTRFAMDARFLDESDEELVNEEGQKNEEGNVEISQEEEKQKQFEILEEILGKKVSRRHTADKEAPDSKRPKMMLRFDPSQPEHSKYEIKEPVRREVVKRKHKESDRQEIEAAEEMPKPEVSKDTFYKVAVDFKDALHEKETFSLANMFSKVIEEESEAQEEKNEKSKEVAKKMLTDEENPFRYDSSSGEDEEMNETLPPTGEAKKATMVQLERMKPTRLWIESFFFKEDDYRLQEGLDFIKRLEIHDQDDFSKMRRNLKQIVKAKLKNNQRKSRPFKKKLGGKKRIKVKRAMKR